MQIHFDGRVTKEDARKAFFANSPYLKGLRWIFGAVLVLLVVSLVVTLQNFKQFHAADILAYLLGIAGFILLLTFPWWMPALQAKSMEKTGILEKLTISGVISENEIVINQQKTRSAFQWGAFVACKITPDLVLLYQTKSVFNIFTRAMFANQGDWDQFVTLARSKFAK